MYGLCVRGLAAEDGLVWVAILGESVALVSVADVAPVVSTLATVAVWAAGMLASIPEECFAAFLFLSLSSACFAATRCEFLGIRQPPVNRHKRRTLSL